METTGVWGGQDGTRVGVHKPRGQSKHLNTVYLRMGGRRKIPR